MLLMGVTYYAMAVLQTENVIILALAILLLAVTTGYILAKLAIEPLKEHFEQLEQFSKETLHELNLPINTITTNTKMLRKNHKDEKSLKRLARIDMACDMLQKRYNELDYLIKRQIQKEIIEIFDLKGLIEQRVEVLQELYSSAKFVMDLETISLKMDKMGFSKVIDNLIDNAIKYSETDSKIDIITREKEKNLEIIIKDYGIGIPENEQKNIFKKFYRVGDELTRERPGAGLGLSIVKEIIEAHKGEILVKSTPGQGSEFTIKLKIK